MSVDPGAILIAGVGGVGARWARAASAMTSSYADLLIIDADPSSEPEPPSQWIPLGGRPGPEGCAALPPVAEERARRLTPILDRVLEDVEFMLLFVGLGGGTGSGVAPWLARRARASGCLVVGCLGLPFEQQVARRSIAQESLSSLLGVQHLSLRVRLDHLARAARERGLDWEDGGGWVPELAGGMVRTLAQVGLINLDLADLRSTLGEGGTGTILVGEASVADPDALWKQACDGPLDLIDPSHCDRILLQIEAGPSFSVSDLEAVAQRFTEGMSDDAQVILGARLDPELVGKVRVIAAIAGPGPNSLE